MRSGRLLVLEVRQFLTGRAWVGLAVILCLLTGSAFAQAIGIFAEGSRSAQTSPELAQALNPFDGILVPTFGSAYLCATLLLPFVVIRQVEQDRSSGALKLLLGLGWSPAQLLARKFLILASAWAIFLLIPSSAAILWLRAGGHLHGAELSGLLGGHLFYGLVVIALAMLAGSLGRSSSTASLMVLAATLGSWVLDFSGPAQGGWLAQLAPVSLTQVLRPLERGVLPLGYLLIWPSFILVALGLAACWLHPGRAVRTKLFASVGAVLVVGLVFFAGSGVQRSWDLTEDLRHSFPPGIERALGRIPGQLALEVRLDAEDPRWMDLDRGILRKLARVVPYLRIIRTTGSGPFGRYGQGLDDHYGEIIYRYQGREDISRSTSSEEILPLLWSLTGTQPPAEEHESTYPGYPMLLAAPPGQFWFRVLLPLLFLTLWISQRLSHPRSA